MSEHEDKIKELSATVKKQDAELKELRKKNGSIVMEFPDVTRDYFNDLFEARLAELGVNDD